MRNHSSVHLLQAALMEVLGDHINQKGSYVCDEYIHFDFSHFNKMSEEEIATVERKVNSWIAEGIEEETKDITLIVSEDGKEETKVLAIEEAKKIGAKALFDDKYGDVVRVVCFGDVSKEFCGGTHVKNTQDIGVFVIESEESVASGVRRIVSRTSLGAYELLKKRENMLNQARKNVGAASYGEVNLRINSLLNEKADMKKQLDSLNSKLANSEANSINSEFVSKDDHEVLVKLLKDTNRNSLANLIDKLKVSHPDSVILLIGDSNDGIAIMCSVNGKGLQNNMAGNIVREVARLLGGSGGGKPEFANGAGRDKSKLDEALKVAKEFIK